MLVRGDGSTLGTIGGGGIEEETVVSAMRVISSGIHETLEFQMTEDYGYACGGSMSIFIEPHGWNPLLVMIGAGHVGQAVTSLAGKCGFRVAVVDERPELLNRELLPDASEILCISAEDSFKQLNPGSRSFVVIATPGHLHDFAAVRASLATETGFIGLLGSRRKRETLFKTLEEEGYDPSDISRIVTPVGLDIGAETPEEIAVSIVSQLISLRRRG